MSGLNVEERRHLEDICHSVRLLGSDLEVPKPDVIKVVKAIQSWANPANTDVAKPTTDISQRHTTRSKTRGSAKINPKLNDEKRFLIRSGYQDERATIYLNQLERLIKGVISEKDISSDDFSIDNPLLQKYLSGVTKDNIVTVGCLLGANKNGVGFSKKENGNLSLTEKALKLFTEG